MKTGILPMILLLTSCQEMESSYFGPFTEKEKVTIVLKDYDTEEVPPQIQELRNATELKISLSSNEGWKVYPPLSYYLNLKEFPPPYKKLPNEITSLTQLQHLSIVGLDLGELPENFAALKNLETVNLAFNKLNLSNELKKLKSLPRLTQLNVMGNVVDTTALKDWMREKPDLEIFYK